MTEVIPNIKKKINAFLVGEEGKISKKSMLKTGAFLGTLALSSAALSNVASAQYTHTNDITASFNLGSFTVTGSHSHHGSHTSHGSHGAGCSSVSW